MYQILEQPPKPTVNELVAEIRNMSLIVSNEDSVILLNFCFFGGQVTKIYYTSHFANLHITQKDEAIIFGKEKLKEICGIGFVKAEMIADIDFLFSESEITENQIQFAINSQNLYFPFFIKDKLDVPSEYIRFCSPYKAVIVRDAQDIEGETVYGIECKKSIVFPMKEHTVNPLEKLVDFLRGTSDFVLCREQEFCGALERAEKQIY